MARMPLLPFLASPGILGNILRTLNYLGQAGREPEPAAGGRGRQGV